MLAGTFSPPPDSRVPPASSLACGKLANRKRVHSLKRSLIRSRYRRHAATQLTHTAQRFNAILDPIYQDHQRTRSLQLSRRRREILHSPLLRAYAIQAVSLSTSLHLSPSLSTSLHLSPPLPTSLHLSSYLYTSLHVPSHVIFYTSPHLSLSLHLTTRPCMSLDLSTPL